MNNHFAFLPMRPSTELLDRPDALRARYEEDGYLLLPGLLPRERILEVRAAILEVLAGRGWVSPHFRRGNATCIATPVREMEEEYLAAYQEVQRLECFHRLAHDVALLDAVRLIVGPTAFPHPLKIARLSFPDHFEASTPPHQDYPNNQGTPALTATWIPLGNVPMELGGLAILAGSHRFGCFPLVAHPGAGNRAADVPLEVQRECRWVTTEFEAGDVLLFGSMTVHASLHNASEFFMRLSVDFRYQQEGEALTAGCLEPHYGRLTWDQVYEGWSSTDLQHYWRDLDYQVVPFEEIAVAGQHVELTAEEEVEAVRYARRRDARVARRMAALAEATGWPAEG